MLLGSETRVKVLRTLAQEAYPQLDLPTLAAETGKSLSGVHQAVQSLTASGLLLRSQRLRKGHYAVDSQHPLAAIIARLFHAEREANNVPHLFPTYWNHLESLTSRLAGHTTVRFILLHGSLLRPPIRPSSDVDLIIGIEPGSEPPHHDGRLLGHDVAMIAIETDRFERGEVEGDAFLASVLERHVVLYVAPGQEIPGRVGERAALPRSPGHGR